VDVAADIVQVLKEAIGDQEREDAHG
jgi:hypothetical protein